MSDEELLELSGSGHGDTSLADAFLQWKAERDSVKADTTMMKDTGMSQPLPTFAGSPIVSAIEDAVTHPTEMVYDWGLLNFIPGFVKPMAAGIGLYASGLNDMLRKGDENISRFADHMIDNPGDWYHLLNGAVIGNGEPVDQDELLRTFEPVRP